MSQHNINKPNAGLTVSTDFELSEGGFSWSSLGTDLLHV